MKKFIQKIKKFSILNSQFLILFLLSAFCLNAQEQLQLPCSSFEKECGWKIVNSPLPCVGQYDEFETFFFYTLNSLCLLECADQTAWPDVVNAQHGQRSIKLVSGRVPVGESFVFLPGMVGTLSKGFVHEFLEEGNEVNIYKLWENYTPHALEGWYKYKPIDGDSAFIDIGFRNQGEEGFIETFVIYNEVENWTKFSIPIPKQYWNVCFDEIRVIFAASAGIVDWDSLQNCEGQLGSTLWIDNINLNYTLDPGDGITQNLFSTLKANAFPNPATEVLNIELNENFSGKITVYNVNGSLVLEENVKGTLCQLNTTELASGNYIYRLMNENTIFAQGKFVITK
jgi:hypothetical protein